MERETEGLLLSPGGGAGEAATDLVGRARKHASPPPQPPLTENLSARVAFLLGGGRVWERRAAGEVARGPGARTRRPAVGQGRLRGVRLRRPAEVLNEETSVYFSLRLLKPSSGFKVCHFPPPCPFIQSPGSYLYLGIFRCVTSGVILFLFSFFFSSPLSFLFLFLFASLW